MTRDLFARVLDLRGRALWLAIASAVAVVAIVSLGVVAVATSMRTGDDLPNLSASPSSPPPIASSNAATPLPTTTWCSEPLLCPSSEPTQDPVVASSELVRYEFGLGENETFLSIAWSPSSTHIAVGTDYSESTDSAEVLVFNLETGEQFLLARLAADPQWSPNGDRLAVITSTDGGNEIVVSDLTGQVMDYYDIGNDRNARSLSWGVDGSAIYFTRGDTWHAADSEVARLDLETGEVATVDQGGLLAVGPSTGMLAYWADANGDGLSNALYVANADGSGRIEIVSEPSLEENSQTRSPVWSPDGTALAYRVSMGAGEYKWFVYDARTGATKELHGVTPSSKSSKGGMLWSPDSQLLLVSSGTSGWVVTRAGELESSANFPFDLHQDEGAAWNPGSTTISTTYWAVHSARVWDLVAGSVEEYTPLDGKNTRHGPMWSPDGRASAWVVKERYGDDPLMLIVEATLGD